MTYMLIISAILAILYENNTHNIFRHNNCNNQGEMNYKTFKIKKR